MRKRRRAMVTLVAVAFFFGIGWYVIFHSHWFPRFLLSTWVHQQYPTFELQSFDYKKRRFYPFGHFPLKDTGGVLKSGIHPWGELSFEDFQVVLQNKTSKYKFFVQSFDIVNHHPLWKQEKTITFGMDGAFIDTPQLRLQGLQGEVTLQWASDSPLHWTGTCEIASLDFDSYHLDKIFMGLEGEQRSVFAKYFSAQGYGGEIQGQMYVDDEVSYDLHLRLSNMDSKALRLVNEQIFSQVNGMLGGEIKISGVGNQIKILTGEANIHSGGKIRASLFSLIVPYIPPSSQRKNLEDLIKINGEIPIDKASLHLNNTGEDKLSTTLDLESQKFNLRLNLAIDVHLDAPLGSLLKQE